MVPVPSTAPARLTALLVPCVAACLVASVATAAEHEAGTPTYVAGAEENYPTLRLGGFSDVDYTSSDVDGSTDGFSLGQFVLHLSSPLAKKVSYFGEISATPHADNFTIEVERSFIRYDYNDAFKISAGRYHTPIGYWNTAYHHGLWLQTTVRRPEQVRFGGEYIPVHFVGLIAEGRLPAGGAGIGYAAGVGNGRSEILSRGGDAGDVNPNRAWIVQLSVRPIQMYGFEAGAALYRDLLSDGAGPDVREWIYSGHLVWTRESPELLSEYIAVRHEVEGGADYDDHAYYVQAAYRLPGRAQFAKPYARYERMDIAAAEPVFALPDLDVVTAGVRFDVIALAAVKAEYRNELAEGAARVQSLLLQASFTF